MAQDGISNLPNALKDLSNYLYKVMPAADRKRDSKNARKSKGVISRSVSGAALTTAGKKISTMNEAIERIENREKRRRAREGLKRTITYLARHNNPERVEALVHILDEVRERNDQTLQDALETVERLAQQGYDPETWVEIFLHINEPEKQDAFLAKTQGILDQGIKDSKALKALMDPLLQRFKG
jgi:hypothetical protein